MQSPTIKRSGLADQVIARVRAIIAEGTYRVGDRLPAEAELSEMFGVGRSTIREAMRVLSNRGLVQVRHGEGTFVTSRTALEPLEERLGRAVLNDIYEARSFLELALSELAARRRDAKDIAAMRKQLKLRAQAIRAGDVTAYAAADFAFHLAIARAAKSAALFDVYESFVETVQPLLKAATTSEYIRTEHDRLHAALCQAIANGNVTETRRLVRSHLNRSLKRVGKGLD
jgi:GntR family transcriptional repressor for pyruvate dehydrogenase complex